MKPGRNDPCPCGSGVKYQHCCMEAASKQHADLFDDIGQTVAMNPNLTIDEVNLLIQQRMHVRNSQPLDDFCGLSPSQMANWLYAPFSELAGLTINTPEDLSGSPVMRYLELIVEEAMQRDGKLKTTPKGNLPTKLVKQASELLPEFAIAKFETVPSISEYTGSNEDNFNALHYTRIMAELAGITFRKSGHIHIKKAAQKQYQNHGVKAFFYPMLEAALRKYNWGYMDGWEDNVDLRMFWLFMLWRLQSHGSIDQMFAEVSKAFPDLLSQLQTDAYFTPIEQLRMLIESRFIDRFLQYWGFVVSDPKRFADGERLSRKVEIQPLLTQAFQFSA